MEGDFLWEQWCIKNNLPKTYEEMKKSYCNISTELADEVWDSQLDKYARDGSKKIIRYCDSDHLAFVYDLYKTTEKAGISVITIDDKNLCKYFVVATLNNESFVINITDMDAIDKPRFIAGVLSNNFTGIDGIEIYKKI
ncbi:MAG: hypothetical protein K0Q47_78 [Sedimentibacter sp.]|jgi:hypothetical protein|nr:hypothetical protein [Sedimentibacter sp.]